MNVKDLEKMKEIIKECCGVADPLKCKHLTEDGYETFKNIFNSNASNGNHGLKCVNLHLPTDKVHVRPVISRNMRFLTHFSSSPVTSTKYFRKN